MAKIENHQLEALKKYLYPVLGEDVTLEKFQDERVLKPYLRDSFHFRITNIFNMLSGKKSPSSKLVSLGGG